VTETQDQTTATFAEARGASRSMDKGIRAVRQVTDAFGAVERNAAETDVGIREISEATDDQATAAEQVVSKVTDVADIGEESTDEAASVSAAAQEHTATVAEVSESVAALSDRAERLQGLLARFTVSDADRADWSVATPRADD
jgi:methyl-accepting chemotaxis protein